jgi:hypothetical protein
LNDGQPEELKHAVPVEMKKGYGSFHRPLLVHGFSGNSSERAPEGICYQFFC